MKKSTWNTCLFFIAKPKLYLKFSNYVFEMFALCCACIELEHAMLKVLYYQKDDMRARNDQQQ